MPLRAIDPPRARRGDGTRAEQPVSDTDADDGYQPRNVAG